MLGTMGAASEPAGSNWPTKEVQLPISRGRSTDITGRNAQRWMPKLLSVSGWLGLHFVGFRRFGSLSAHYLFLEFLKN